MEKPPPKPKPVKSLTKDDFMSMDKNELIEKIIQLQAHNTQLKNIINKSLSNSTIAEEKASSKKFDFSKCCYRRVLLQIMYFGWDYQGLAVQEDSTQTIEHHLFHALTKSCLIESRETSQYHRCGRTDKGVSAFGQIISISLRSKFQPSEQDEGTSLNTEIPYCKVLNRLLPKEIRAITWMPIPQDKPEFSARFDCKKRQYKYYFPRSALNIAAMRNACARLVGSHDFRHLCKMDVGNGVTEFRREVLSADILPVDDDSDDPTCMYHLVIEGNAFLWHQIRCIMGVLLLVGEGRESPQVVSNLLDINTYPCKPQYSLALDVPLNLFHCSYALPPRWRYDGADLRALIAHVQAQWTLTTVKATMMKDTLKQLQDVYKSLSSDDCQNEIKYSNCTNERDTIIAYTDCLLQGVKARVYTPLLKRETCLSLEDRIEYYKKKRRIGDGDKRDNNNKK